MKVYVAPDGTQWHRRGDQVLTGTALARRLRKPHVIAVHHYLGELADIPVDQREGFWSDAESRMAVSGFSDFRGIEFRSDAGDLLLVIDESC